MVNPITANAPRLRLFLGIVLILLIITGGVVTTLGLSYLRGFSKEVNEVVSKASTSSDRINEINLQIAEYEKNESTVKLASQVVAKRSSYQYQNDAYSDLLAIAKRAGVTIDQYTFESEQEAATAGEPSGAAPTTNQSKLTESSSGGLAAQTSSLKPVSIKITLSNPVNYTRFLNFLHYIEQNLTKMQIKSISLSSSGSLNNKDSVNTDSVTVEVYTQ